MNLIPGIAELACPYLLLYFPLILLLFYGLYLAYLIENTLTRGAELCVTSGQLSSVLQAIEGHLKDVGVELDRNPFMLCLLLLGPALA